MCNRMTLPVAFIALLCGCGNEPPASPLPKAEGASFRTFVTYYSDDRGSAWRPFKIETSPVQYPDERDQVVVAEQCEDVSVIQSRNAVYVFYGEIVARDFSSMTYQQQEPQTYLCDVHLPLCKTARDTLLKNGGKISRVCPSRTRDGQPGA